MEVGAVDPHAMHDNREPPSEGDLGRLCTASLRDPHRPRAERRPASVMQQDVRRLVEGGSNHLIAATTDATIVVCLAELYRRGVSPKWAPTFRDRAKRSGASMPVR